MTISTPPHLVVAMDFASADECLAMARRLSPRLCRLKVGKELFTTAGPALVERLIAQGFDVFLDLKFHDIPHTTAQAVKAAAQLGVWMVNVHASGGLRMMSAAREILEPLRQPPLLIAVTVLTSLEAEDLVAVGVTRPLEQQVLDLATLARQAGLDGVVCSAREARQLKRVCGADFLLVTPGIRPPGSDSDDQRRIVTPGQARRDGSDYLVVGRPVTRAADPLSVCESILRSIDGIGWEG